MLVAQLGSSDGGSTTTAAVEPSTERQPRLCTVLQQLDVGYILVGNDMQAEAREQANCVAPPTQGSANNSRGRSLCVVSVRLVPGTTALGPHKVTPGVKLAPCNTSPHVSGCTEWHFKCRRRIMQLLA